MFPINAHFIAAYIIIIIIYYTVKMAAHSMLECRLKLWFQIFVKFMSLILFGKFLATRKAYNRSMK